MPPSLPVVTGTSHRTGPPAPVLECVPNLSEGCAGAIIKQLGAAAGACLLDVHSDCHHHRSVLTLAGRDEPVQVGVRDLARAVVRLLDLRQHTGAHPRFGVLDVVPWVALDGWPLRDQDGAGEGARKARDAFAHWASTELNLPVFLYGPERSLPEVRRGAWRALRPDLGPAAPHPTAGAVAVGCRPLMVAYNLWLAHADLTRAKAVAAAVRSPAVRALAFSLGSRVQVSCNLVRPLVVGPAAIWDEVAQLSPIAKAELVGLVPRAVLDRTPEERWGQLDLALDRTIEARLDETRSGSRDR
jgi:glutamate formiminotransferase / 5-formyltetrahydrofolate cyclo-ligase